MARKKQPAKATSDAAPAPPPPPEPAPKPAPEAAPEAPPATVAVAGEASDQQQPAKLIVVAALVAAVGGTVLQTILTGLQLPWAATFFSPLHAVCLIAMLLIQVCRRTPHAPGPVAPAHKARPALLCHRR